MIQRQQKLYSNITRYRQSYLSLNTLGLPDENLVLVHIYYIMDFG